MTSTLAAIVSAPAQNSNQNKAVSVRAQRAAEASVKLAKSEERLSQVMSQIEAAEQAGKEPSADIVELAELLIETCETLRSLAGSHEPACSMKVSAKGALSLYGLGRWPVTLYRGQWEKLIAKVPEIQAFIQAHAAELSEKPAK